MITTHVLEALIKILPPATSQEEFKGYAADAARKFIEVRGSVSLSSLFSLSFSPSLLSKIMQHVCGVIVFAFVISSF